MQPKIVFGFFGFGFFGLGVRVSGNMPTYILCHLDVTGERPNDRSKYFNHRDLVPQIFFFFEKRQLPHRDDPMPATIAAMT